MPSPAPASSSCWVAHIINVVEAEVQRFEWHTSGRKADGSYASYAAIQRKQLSEEEVAP